MRTSCPRTVLAVNNDKRIATLEVGRPDGRKSILLNAVLKARDGSRNDGKAPIPAMHDTRQSVMNPEGRARPVVRKN